MDRIQLQPGHRLDRYELLCPLAYGGMASVWLARFGGRRGFERLVVVKMILPQFASDPRFQEMFVDEARIASRIEHANVARILDVGEHDENTTYIVMEWVDGDSLSKIIRAAEQKKQHVPAGIALRICADAAAGLHAAHVLKERDGTELGVVHRDVSPQNILVSNAGTTVIIDFGVAKARDRVSQDTSAGQLKGKIRYMAPEQALGKDLDRRADVWGIGAILYELVAGESPYDGPNEVATLHNLTRGAAPNPLPDTVPDAVRAVIGRALAYAPEDRYATALELNLALESAMVEIGEPTSTAAVARYTESLLAERKAARRRGVDDALAVAHARDAERTASAGQSSTGTRAGFAVPDDRASAGRTRSLESLASIGNPASDPSLAQPSLEVLPAAPSEPPNFANVTARIAPSAHSFSFPPLAAPANPGSLPLGYAESPSGASSATIGGGTLEFPHDASGEAARRRRFLTAAVLGVSVVAGAIGIALIISAAVLHREHETKAAGGATAPIEAADPPSASSPNPMDAGSAAADPATTGATTPSTPASNPPVAPSTAPPGSRRAWPPVTRPRTAPTPAVTTPGKPDRGF